MKRRRRERPSRFDKPQTPSTSNDSIFESMDLGLGSRELQDMHRALKEQYLGKHKKKKKMAKPSEKFSNIFKFNWDADEDTSADSNPLYARKFQVNGVY